MTFTLEAVSIVLTYATIPAGTIRARQFRLFAVAPGVLHGTLADESVVPGVQAGPSVLARGTGAPVKSDLAVGAVETLGTHARVGARGRVDASGSVLARLVVGAVVEVLLAQHATPPLLAFALVGVVTRAVQASGVHYAFVAPWTLPAARAAALIRAYALSVAAPSITHGCKI